MNIGWQGAAIIVVVVVLVVGFAELPAIVRSMRTALKEFHHHTRHASSAQEHPGDIEHH